VTHEVPAGELGNAQTFGYYLWFKYLYRIPGRSDVSNLVNHQTAVAGVTENQSFIRESAMGDRALATFL
jgi:hypothetical protein